MPLEPYVLINTEVKAVQFLKAPEPKEPMPEGITSDFKPQDEKASLPIVADVGRSTDCNLLQSEKA